MIFNILDMRLVHGNALSGKSWKVSLQYEQETGLICNDKNILYCFKCVV